MIRILRDEDEAQVMKLLRKETITNYFIIMSLERSKWEELYDKKWGEFNQAGELIAILLKRKTGNMQFYTSGGYDALRFSNILRVEGFKQLIGEQKVLQGFEENYPFSRKEKSSFISKLDRRQELPALGEQYIFHRLMPHHMDQVIALYEKIFKGFASRKTMVEKLEKGTGRGYFIEEKGKIISVAQSAYEDKDSAVIVGVGTDPDYQKKGYASACMVKLSSELLKEEKDLYLQYDNEEAGRIYRQLGFVDIGRMAIYSN